MLQLKQVIAEARRKKAELDLTQGQKTLDVNANNYSSIM